MKQSTNRTFCLAGGMIVLALLSGCVINRVGIHYTAQSDVTPIARAERVSVNVEVVDARLIRDRIGQLGTNGNRLYGPVIATNDPVAVLSEAVESELANRGFQVSNHGGPLVVHLEKLYGVFDVSDWSVKVTSRIRARIRKADGTIIYQTVVTGEGEARAAKSETQAAAPFAEALQNCLRNLFADPKFINALLNASD